jgi:transcriptional regulator of acetoin/glycerol metabolism
MVEHMFSNPRNELRVSQAWETLLSGGELPSGAVRTLVDQSWQRCAQAQVDPLRRRGALPVSGRTSTCCTSARRTCWRRPRR